MTLTHLGAVAVVAILSLGLSVKGADTSRHYDELISAPGNRFIAALATERPEAVQKCWLSWDTMEGLLKNPPDGIPAPAGVIARAKTYWAKRDREIQDLVPLLLEAMRKGGVHLPSLKHDRTEGVIQKGGYLLSVYRFRIHAVDENQTGVILSVDDGILLEGKWHFRDRLIHEFALIRNGRLKIIKLEPPAN